MTDIQISVTIVLYKSGGNVKNEDEILRNLIKDQSSLLRALQDLGPMLRGTIQTVKVKCGKPNCKCTRGEPHLATFLVYRKDKKLKKLYLGKKVPSNIERMVNDYRMMQDLMVEFTNGYVAIIEIKKKADKRSEQEAKRQLEQFMSSLDEKTLCVNCIKKDKEIEKLREQLERISNISVIQYKRWRQRYKKKMKNRTSKIAKNTK